ncbi:MAG: cytochrome c, partial [Pseudomonadota bacterium]
GRTDALGRIANTVFGDHMIPANYHVADAPVSYPYVWNIWKFDWVQYNGSVSQPLARNIGESLGVGAVIDLVNAEGKPLPEERRFSNSVRIPDLVTIERTLQRLTPPPWPAEIFGAVDAQKAAHGRDLFEQHCQGCHGPHVAPPALQTAQAPGKLAPGTEWQIEVIPVEHIGTDPSAAMGFVERRYDLRPIGITNSDAVGVLRPVRLRQLARDFRYHLGELVESAPAGGPLKALLAQLPADGPAPALPEALLGDIADAVEGVFGERADASGDSPPSTATSCNTDCHADWLVWHGRRGLSAMAATLDAFDVGSVTEGEGLNIIGLFIKQ